MRSSSFTKYLISLLQKTTSHKRLIKDGKRKTQFWLLASVFKEPNCKGSRSTVLIELSFNMETVLI